jgi:hypothetical protein
LLVIVAVAVVLAMPSPACADPAGPTDFESTVVDIDPPAGGVDVEIIGGDAFVLLTVSPGVSVYVIGYRGEPYLRFLTSGVVEVNDNAPSTYLNEDRYAAVEIPSSASPDAAPSWRRVASDGSYAWHDHRAHWMNESPPPGRGPGDRILEGVVPLLVDGQEVDVAIASTWQAPPSPVPAVVGIVTGIGIALAALRWTGRRTAPLGTMVLAAAALGVGATAVLSVPSETAPSWTLWLAPASSLVLAAPAALGTRAPVVLRRWAPLLAVIAALELVVWSVLRWDTLWRAILPTAAPYWLDRLVTAGTLAGSALITIVALRAVVSPDAAQ